MSLSTAGTIYEVVGVVGREVHIPCSSAHFVYNSPSSYSPDSFYSSHNSRTNQVTDSKQPDYNQGNSQGERTQSREETSTFLRHRSNNLSLRSGVGALHKEFTLNSRKLRPFMRPGGEDKPILVLWYKDGLGIPIYR